MGKTNLLPLDAGYVLQGKKHSYTIKKTLGSGGFGITYFAEKTVYEGNIPQKHEFAIKEFGMRSVCSRDANKNIVVPSEKNDDVEACKQEFIKEAERLHNMSHPGIVPVNEIIYANNTVYYVMQHLGSMSLTRFVKEHGGRLDESSARRIIRQVAEAVSYLHNQRITHLDIKPDNIMIVDPEGQSLPVLIDFGLAGHYKSNGKLTSKLNVSGISEGYSPIEQYLGLDSFTPQADIYAMGATFFYMLTGKDPVKASEMSNRYIYANLPEDVSDQTGQIITGCMQKLKEQRLQSVESIISMLDGDSPDESSEANEKATQLIKSRKPGGSSSVPQKYVYGGIAAALVAVVIGLALLLSGKGDSQPASIPDDDAVVSENTQTENVGESQEDTPAEEADKETVNEPPDKTEEGQDKDKQQEKTEPQTVTTTITTPAAPRVKNPRWGRYEGARNRDGLPHGNGVVYITGSATLNGVEVSSGDRIEGLFRDGYLNFGTLYQQDGTEVKLKDVNLF